MKHKPRKSRNPSMYLQSLLQKVLLVRSRLTIILEEIITKADVMSKTSSKVINI